MGNRYADWFRQAEADLRHAVSIYFPIAQSVSLRGQTNSLSYIFVVVTTASRRPRLCLRCPAALP